MQPNFHSNSGTNSSNLPPLPSKKPKINAERKQFGENNIGFDSNSENNLSVKPKEEKQYKKVVRRQPRPPNVDDKAAENIDARNKALQNRFKRSDPNRSNDELDINATDNEQTKSNINASALANALNRNKGAPPTVISNQKKPSKQINRKTIKDDDMYDLPDYSRTNSEIEAAKREGQSSDDEEYIEKERDYDKLNACLPFFSSFQGNWLVFLSLILALVAIAFGSTAIGLALKDKG